MRVFHRDFRYHRRLGLLHLLRAKIEDFKPNKVSDFISSLQDKLIQYLSKK